MSDRSIFEEDPGLILTSNAMRLAKVEHAVDGGAGAMHRDTMALQDQVQKDSIPPSFNHQPGSHIGNWKCSSCLCGGAGGQAQ